jgi:hypothetical protein
MRATLVGLILCLASPALADKTAVIRLDGHDGTFYPRMSDQACDHLVDTFSYRGPFIVTLDSPGYDGLSGLVTSISCEPALDTLDRPAPRDHPAE